MLFRDKVRLLRIQLNVSQKELAGIIGMGKTSIADWESGETLPSQEKMDRVSKLLKAHSEKALKRREDEGKKNCPKIGRKNTLKVKEGLVSDFAKMIRRKRFEKDLTVVALAKEVGVGRQAISEWETGESVPSFSSMQKLAEILQFNLEDHELGQLRIECADLKGKQKKWRAKLKARLSIQWDKLIYKEPPPGTQLVKGV